MNSSDIGMIILEGDEGRFGSIFACRNGINRPNLAVVGDRKWQIQADAL